MAGVNVVPMLGWWWASAVGLLAFVLGLHCSGVVIEDMDKLVKKLAAPDGYLRADLVVKRERRFAKWLMVPILVWWLPLFSSFGAMAFW